MKGGKRCRVVEGREKSPKCVPVSHPGGRDVAFVTVRQENKS